MSNVLGRPGIEKCGSSPLNGAGVGDEKCPKERVKPSGTPYCFEGDTNTDICEARGKHNCQGRPGCLWGKPPRKAAGLGRTDVRGLATTEPIDIRIR